MDRRNFLKSGAALSSAVATASLASMAHAGEQGWRTFEVITQVELLGSAPARVWLPVPSVNTGYQKIISNRFSAGTATASIVQDPRYGAGILAAQFKPSDKPVVELVSQFSTRDRAVTPGRPTGEALSETERRKYLESTTLLPTDGIVSDTARDITKGQKNDVDRARAIYEWIVDNTHRDGAVRGCGVGDIKSMLETKNLGGKCADLNALFVGLARAAGIPARDVYGIRVADSRLGYKSLGKSGDISKAQHCRAEFYLAGTGWVPVDPADVRKVILEENGGLPIDDAKVEAARKRLFGQWEMNWLAYNYAHDVQLPGAAKGPIGFLMYPKGEAFDQGRLVRMDSLDPDNFRYKILAREILA